jgi:hypothetical protein
LWANVIVDDLWQQIALVSRRPTGQMQRQCSVTMAFVGECREWNIETTMLSKMSN